MRFIEPFLETALKGERYVLEAMDPSEYEQINMGGVAIEVLKAALYTFGFVPALGTITDTLSLGVSLAVYILKPSASAMVDLVVDTIALVLGVVGNVIKGIINQIVKAGKVTAEMLKPLLSIFLKQGVNLGTFLLDISTKMAKISDTMLDKFSKNAAKLKGTWMNGVANALESMFQKLKSIKNEFDTAIQGKFEDIKRGFELLLSSSDVVEEYFKFIISGKVVDGDNLKKVIKLINSGDISAEQAAKLSSKMVDLIDEKSLPKEEARKIYDILKETNPDSFDGLFKKLDDLFEGAGKVISLWKKSLCSKDELYKYLKNIDGNAADLFKTDEIWPSGIQIPKNSSALNADGTINWGKAPKGGYTLDANGNPLKNEYVPKIGEVIDRYGAPNGRYTSPITNGNAYSYDQRALPFIEDPSQYHKYEVIGDLSKLKDYVNNCKDMTLKNRILDDINYYYNGDFSKVVNFKGQIAKIDGWGVGGGIQYELPITVQDLEKLGILKELR